MFILGPLINLFCMNPIADIKRFAEVLSAGLGQNSVRVFANAVRVFGAFGRSGSKRSGRVLGFLFCSALFLDCSVFCFVR